MFRRIHVFMIAVVVALAANVLVQAGPVLASANAKEIGFEGSAYGTSVNVGGIVKSGRSALSVLGCTSQVGVTHTNTAASVNAAVLTTGTIDTSTASETTGSGVASTSTTTVQGVSVLGGLVSATALQSASTTSRNNSTNKLSVSAAGTTFANLTVAGVPINVQPGPNTTIGLPGVGEVILNQQTGNVGTSKAGLTVIAIHVIVNITTPLAPKGTQIVVSYANSSLGGPFGGLLTGLSYAASANVLSSTVLVGQVFPQPLACFGTGGATRTNGGALVTVRPVLVSGTAVDTAEGTVGKNPQAETSAAIQTLNLLSGLVTATAVKADVTATGNPPALGDNSSFVHLVVAGTPVTIQPAPNTKISLAGIGTLWLHRVIKTSTSIRVIMIELIVTVPGNPLGLALNTTVTVASAKVGINN
jgi:hypothetical protein